MRSLMALRRSRARRKFASVGIAFPIPNYFFASITSNSEFP
jgi:hypothetical protein